MQLVWLHLFRFITGFLGVDVIEGTGVETLDVDVEVAADVGILEATEALTVESATATGVSVAGWGTVVGGAGSAAAAEEGEPVPPRMGRRRCKVLFCGIEREERVECCEGSTGETDSVR